MVMKTTIVMATYISYPLFVRYFIYIMADLSNSESPYLDDKSEALLVKIKPNFKPSVVSHNTHPLHYTSLSTSLAIKIK